MQDIVQTPSWVTNGGPPMLGQLSTLAWWEKSILAMLLSTSLPCLLAFFGKNYAVDNRAFLCAWLFGVAALIVILAVKSDTFEMTSLYTPLTPLLLIIVFGAIFGGTPNILIAEAAVPANQGGAPNATLPFAIMSAAFPIAYIFLWVAGRFLPTYFDPVPFNAVNFVGILAIAAGTAMATYRS